MTKGHILSGWGKCPPLWEKGWDFSISHSLAIPQGFWPSALLECRAIGMYSYWNAYLLECRATLYLGEFSVALLAPNP